MTETILYVGVYGGELTPERKDDLRAVADDLDWADEMIVYEEPERSPTWLVETAEES